VSASVGLTGAKFEGDGVVELQRASSLRTYAILAVSVALAAALVRFVPAGPLTGVFSFPVVAGFLVLGLLGVLLCRGAGIPEMWS
jgi:hypothetical protein